MGVCGERGGEPGPEEAARRVLALGRLRARERAYVHLDARAALYLFVEDGDRGAEAGGTLRVCQQRREAPAAELLSRLEQVVPQPAERDLEEHPAPPRRAVGDHVEVLIRQGRERERLELPAALHAQLDPLLGE